MAIGITPVLLPPRVATDPPTGVQRPGVLDSQVFGKPFLDFSPSALFKTQPVKSYSITLKSMLEEDAKANRGLDVSSGTADAPNIDTYSRSARNPVVTPLGTFLNTKA
jgi:hypothetical protein